jgi:hypothetical protein
VNDDGVLFEGVLGRMHAEDVLQVVPPAAGLARVSFEVDDRVLASPHAVDVWIEGGALVGLGPRGGGIRLGDLAVLRHVVPRAEVEAAAEGDGPPLGERLVARGALDAQALDDLLWERHARVVWALLAWDRGRFRVVAAPADERPPIAVDPPLALSGLLLDGLQRAEESLGPLTSS